MTVMTFDAWRPGVLVAGAAHPECAQWDRRFMSRFLEDAAKGLHPDVPMGQLMSTAAMHHAALEAELIIREMTS